MNTDGMASEELVEDPESILDEQPRTELDRLRKLHKQLHKKRTIDIDVPGYEGELIVRYHGIDWDDVSKIMTRIQQIKPAKKGVSDRELFAMIDTMIAACEEIFWRDPETLKLVSLDMDRPLKFDERIGPLLLQSEVQTSREAVRRLFNNDMALVAHHGELVEFLQGASEGATEDLAGESLGQR